MANYSVDPNSGLLVVTQDDGTKLPGMAPYMAPELEASGITRFFADSPLPPKPTDGGGGAGNEPDPPPGPLASEGGGGAPNQSWDPSMGGAGGQQGKSTLESMGE